MYTWNERGQLETRTDETGIVDKFEYNSTNETLEKATRDFGVGRLNLETNLGYNAWGDVNSITDPRGNETTFDFDNERRMTKRIECAPFGFETNWIYNDNGWLGTLQRQTGEIDPEFQEWNWAYNIHGDVVTITDPAGKELNFELDEMRRLVSRTDAQGRKWQFEYDADSRIIKVTDPMGNFSETRTYTDNGMLATITDARSNTTEIAYDGFDRLSKRIYPDSTFEQFGYNFNSQVLTMLTRKGDTITNTFDPLARLATRDPGSLPMQTMAYDLTSRLLSVSTPAVEGDPSSGIFSFGYDTAGRLISQSSPTGEDPPSYRVIGYQLDENGNRTRLIWPDAYYAEYLFDELNRLTDIKLNGSSSSAVAVAYDALSRRTALTYLNGCSAAYGYAINNDLTSLEHTFVGSSLVFGYNFNFVHQVTEQSVSDDEFLWKPSAVYVTSYAPANSLNQYPSVAEDAYDYDENGNLTSGPFTSAAFDVINRVTQIVAGGITNNYWNDPLSRQAQKEVDSTKTDFLYDGVQLIAEYNSGGSLVKRYIPGSRLDEILVQIAGGTTTYLHQDRLGSTVAQTNTSGAVLNKHVYSPFGETPSLPGTIFGFTGQRYDAEIGQYNYKARQYAPVIGRFLQPDPIGYGAGDMNLYAYVRNDPVNLIDPVGLWKCGCKFAGDDGDTDEDTDFVAGGRVYSVGGQSFSSPTEATSEFYRQLDDLKGQYNQATWEIIVKHYFPFATGAVNSATWPKPRGSFGGASESSSVASTGGRALLKLLGISKFPVRLWTPNLNNGVVTAPNLGAAVGRYGTAAAYLLTIIESFAAANEFGQASSQFQGRVEALRNSVRVTGR